ncbi:MAG TPA: hemolysin family protein [Acidobacteriaceae bacterium]
MILIFLVLIGLLLVLHTLASYIDRLYSEMGKFLSREFQENIDVWEQRIEPRMGLSREQLTLLAAVIAQLSLACLALLFGVMVFDRGVAQNRPATGEVAQALLGSILVIVLFNRLLPYVFFARTRGEWLVRFTWPLRVLFYLFLPVTLLIGFLYSIVALVSQEETTRGEDEAAAVDALIEAGQEEGILEEADHDLIRSAVEFGDKVVREVMTPRPHIFAVQASATLEELLVGLEQNPFSRVPVYTETLDTMTGIVFAHDLLQIPDVDAKTQSVASIARPASFVPETKKASELLREMQREKQHMRIVIDEYGGVSGLVTIEDLLEEIVGSIDDEHDDDENESVMEESEPAGGKAWTVPGSLDLTRLEELLGGGWQAPEDYEATTVAGLVSESAGRIPMAGEVVEENGLRFAILASTDRRIERLRVSLPGDPGGRGLESPAAGLRRG